MSPLDGMLVHHRVIPQHYVAGTHFIHLGGERRMWGKVSCLRKQHNGRDWVSNRQPSDLKSSGLTTTPPSTHTATHTATSPYLIFPNIPELRKTMKQNDNRSLSHIHIVHPDTCLQIIKHDFSYDCRLR